MCQSSVEELKAFTAWQWAQIEACQAEQKEACNVGLFNVSVESGKYVFKTADGLDGVLVERGGEPWLTLQQGSKAVLALMGELEEARLQLTVAAQKDAELNRVAQSLQARTAALEVRLAAFRGTAQRPTSVDPPQGCIGVSYWEGQKLLACLFQPLDGALPTVGDTYELPSFPLVQVVARHWKRTEEGKLTVDVECELAEKLPGKMAWVVRHEATAQLLDLFLRERPDRRPNDTTVAELLVWAGDKMQSQSTPGAVCSYCGGGGGGGGWQHPARSTDCTCGKLPHTRGCAAEGRAT